MQFRELSTLISEISQVRQGKTRLVVAVAGPPAAGKSTFAAALQEALTSEAAFNASVVPMDGFHLDNIQLDRLNLRARKGAPDSFDFEGFYSLLKRIKTSVQPIFYPIFDRSSDKAIAGAGAVLPNTDVVIVEGNYLLLDEPPWNKLADIFDHSIYLQTDIPVLEKRLVQRWLDHGHTEEEARKRANSNDIPNAKRLDRRMRAPTTILVAEEGNWGQIDSLKSEKTPNPESETR